MDVRPPPLIAMSGGRAVTVGPREGRRRCSSHRRRLGFLSSFVLTFSPPESTGLRRVPAAEQPSAPPSPALDRAGQDPGLVLPGRTTSSETVEWRLQARRSGFGWAGGSPSAPRPTPDRCNPTQTADPRRDYKDVSVPTTSISTSSFAETARRARDLGWTAVLPLPHGQKKSPPVGYSGAEAKIPTDEDYAAWSAQVGERFNIAVVMPANVVGIDQDVRDGKRGDLVVAEAEARLGKLEPTF